MGHQRYQLDLRLKTAEVLKVLGQQSVDAIGKVVATEQKVGLSRTQKGKLLANAL